VIFLDRRGGGGAASAGRNARPFPPVRWARDLAREGETKRSNHRFLGPWLATDPVPRRRGGCNGETTLPAKKGGAARWRVIPRVVPFGSAARQLVEEFALPCSARAST